MTDQNDNRRHLLLLAGSGEARRIAAGLASCRDWRVTMSRHVPPRLPESCSVPMRLGGFGGEAGFLAYLEAEHIAAVLDATHPFATHISGRTRRLCAERALPYAQVLRPPWKPGPGDQWREVADEAAAAALIRLGARAFTTTGRATLGGFAGFAGARLFVRRLINGADRAIDKVTYVPDAGPFSVADEIRTLSDLAIDVLIVRNSGGDASRTKLDAARHLGIPVILIARPSGVGDCLPDVQAALDWVKAL